MHAHDSPKQCLLGRHQVRLTAPEVRAESQLLIGRHHRHVHGVQSLGGEQSIQRQFARTRLLASFHP